MNRPQIFTRSLALVFSVLGWAATSHAMPLDDSSDSPSASTLSTPDLRDHGPGSHGFSHSFQMAPRSYDGGQIGVHFGLSQPLLLDGHNAAVDGHVGRWVLEYSHGWDLDYNRLEEQLLSQEERAADMTLKSPWTTGFGVGYRLFDEFYPMIEVKAHKYRASVDTQTEEYTTVSIGPALAHRLFLFRGVFLNSYVRYWPNLWTSRDNNRVDFDSGLRHEAMDLGFFANLSLGYAFDLP